METLREIIRQSERERSSTVPPMRLSFSAGSIANFVAKLGELDDRAQAAAAAALFDSSAGKDHVNLVASAIDRGVRFRLEIEEGILQAIGQAAQDKAANSR